MTDIIEKRVTDLESLMSDLPQIINLRFERIDTALRDNAARFDETSGRLNLLDKQMGMMLRDMRDLRGGVTRMLIAQDEEIAGIKRDVGVIKTDVAGLKTDVAGLKSDVAGLKSDAGIIKMGMDVLQASKVQILGRLPAP